jgi:hypothetical protein
MDQDHLQVGAVISVWHLLYWHKGIVSRVWPSAMVIHNSKSHGRVVEEHIDQFSEGQRPQVVWRPESWQAAFVVSRARTFLGQRYELTKFNCEHLVTAAQGVKPNSEQLGLWIVLGVCAGILFAISRS